MKNFLFRLTHPNFWLQNTPTSKAWDKKLNELLDGGDPVILSACEAEVGGHRIWISNYPYAYGYLCQDPHCYLPMAITRVRLKKAIDSAFWASV